MNIQSKRLEAISPSPTLAISQMAKELTAAGQKILSLAQGEPDFDTPAHIKEAAIKAIQNGHTKYTAVDGMPQLKQAIRAKFSSESGVEYLAENISVGSGVKQLIYNALTATIDPGDEVIVIAPYWVSYIPIIELAGGTPCIVESGIKDDFAIPIGEIRSSITHRTKWIILNSPGNPTGKVYGRGEIEEFARMVREHENLMVLSDDIYEDLVFDGVQHRNLVSVDPALADRCLVCSGVSKTFAMTGWRIGYAAGPVQLIKAMGKLQSQSTSNPCSISQYAALAALQGDQKFLINWTATYQHRRDICLDRLNEIDGLTCTKPNGAFYLFPNCQGLIGRRTNRGNLISSGNDMASWLLEAAGVAVVPGSAFGCDPFIRLSFASSEADLIEGIDKIARACSDLS